MFKDHAATVAYALARGKVVMVQMQIAATLLMDLVPAVVLNSTYVMDFVLDTVSISPAALVVPISGRTMPGQPV